MLLFPVTLEAKVVHNIWVTQRLQYLYFTLKIGNSLVVLIFLLQTEFNSFDGDDLSVRRPGLEYFSKGATSFWSLHALVYIIIALDLFLVRYLRIKLIVNSVVVELLVRLKVIFRVSW